MTTDPTRRELDARAVGNDVVRLLFEPETGRCVLVIERAGSGAVEVDVAPRDAADALAHPYLYAPPEDAPPRDPRRRRVAR
jgi:hypothetical protein